MRTCVNDFCPLSQSVVIALRSAELLCSLFGCLLTPFPLGAPHQAEQEYFALCYDDVLKQSLEHLDFRPTAHLCFHFSIVYKQSRKAV